MFVLIYFLTGMIVWINFDIVGTVIMLQFKCITQAIIYCTEVCVRVDQAIEMRRDISFSF